jgi:hypothetical protein
MTRASVTIEVVTENTAWLHTTLNGQALYLWLEKLSVPRQYNAKQRLWMVPRGRVADLVADCEASCRPVHVTGVWS